MKHEVNCLFCGRILKVGGDIQKIGKSLYISHYLKNGERFRKCSNCGEMVSENYERFDRHLNIWCESCYSNNMQYASTCVTVIPNFNTYSVQFTEFFSDEDENQLPTPVKAEHYRHTDGWRGYTYWEYEPGYIEYADGWSTGYPDEYHRRKADFNRLYEKIYNEELVPPCPVYFLFGITSNVFSTSTAMVIHQDNLAAMREWLDRDEINRMLG